MDEGVVSIPASLDLGEEVAHDAMGGFRCSGHFDMELGGINGKAAPLDTLDAGNGAFTRGDDEFPTARRPGDLAAVALHHLEFVR